MPPDPLEDVSSTPHWDRGYTVRVGSVAVEHSTVAPGTLMGNPKCLSTLYETSSYPTAPPKEISGAAHAHC